MAQMSLAFDGTWDIETEDWSTFVMGGLHTPNGGTETYDDADAMFDALLSLPNGTYWAHNAGRFDGLWMVEMLLKRGIDWTGAMRGSAIIEVKAEGKTFRDSYAVFPEPLSVVAEAGGSEKIKTDLPCNCARKCQCLGPARGAKCVCEESCGGYCSIKRNMPPEHRRKTREYLAQDCIALDKGLRALADYATRVDIDLRGTIGASAWTTCARWIGLDTKRPAHSIQLYRQLRAGYYGGRNEVYQTLADSGNRYDIHSSYPAALSAIRLPTGDIRSANPNRAFAMGYDGVYTARVHVPECYSPPLPIRTADRLAYCHGTFSGTWTGIELRHAVECGAEILTIEEGIYTEQTEPVLKQYADRIWGLRDRAKREERDGIYRWVKWIANSLTGKLAMQPSVVTLASFPEDLGMKPGETRVLQKHGRLVVAREVERVSSCAHVEWAAHLTAFARTELHRQLLAAGDDAVYCDTDSVYTTGTLNRRVGDALGEWGHEGSMDDWECLAPKIYRYWHEQKERYVTKGKGMSGLTAQGFDDLKDGKAWKVDRGVETLKTAIRKGKGIFTKKSLSRSLAEPGPHIGSRARVGKGTRAVDFDAYMLATA